MDTIRYLLSFLLLSLSLANEYPQDKVKLFVDHIVGPDKDVSTRILTSFRQELQKLKSVERVNDRDEATYTISLVWGEAYAFEYRPRQTGLSEKPSPAPDEVPQRTHRELTLSILITARDRHTVAEVTETKTSVRKPGDKGERDERDVAKAVVEALKKKLKWK